MSDLTATDCGCGCGQETRGEAYGLNGGNWIWLLILLYCCGGCGGNNASLFSTNGDGCGNNSCYWIILLLLLCNNCGSCNGY